jgi:hypothetical protein
VRLPLPDEEAVGDSSLCKLLLELPFCMLSQVLLPLHSPATATAAATWQSLLAVPLLLLSLGPEER